MHSGAFHDDLSNIGPRPEKTSETGSAATALSATEYLLQEPARAVVNPRRGAGAKMLRRAVERGEIRPDFDLELAQDLVGGPLYLRGVILDEEFPPGYAERLTDAVLRILGDAAAPT